MGQIIEMGFGSVGAGPKEDLFFGQVDPGELLTEQKMEELKKYAAEEVIPKIVEMAQTSDTIGTLPTYLLPDYQDLVRKTAPFYDMITKRRAEGKVISYNAITAYPSGAFANEMATLSNTDATVISHNVNVRYAYVQELFSNIARAIAEGNFNYTNEFLRYGVRGLMQAIENALLFGDGSAPNPLGATKMVDGGDNLVDKAGAAIALSDIDDVIEAIISNGFPQPTVGLTDPGTLRAIAALVDDDYSNVGGSPYNRPGTWTKGVTYNGVTFYAHWAFPTSDYDSGTGEGGKSIYLFNPDVLEIHELQPVVTEDLGKSQTQDGYLYRHKWYGAIIDLSANDSGGDGTGSLACGLIEHIA